MIASTPATRRDRAAVQSYLERVPDGATIKWVEIETATGVTMNPRGRQIVRQALLSLKRPAASVRGVGIELSAPATALTIMGDRFVRIDNAVRSADRTQRHLVARHLEAMAPASQQKLLLLAGFFGAVRAEAAQHRALLSATKETRS